MVPRFATLCVCGAVIVACFSVLCVLVRADGPAAPAQPVTVKAGEYALSGPYAHDNLTVYLLHGGDRMKGKHYVTLQEAIQDKIIVVHETGNVNELQIENVSPDVDVYVQSGDIVKGGRQDRTIASDFICPPKSGKMPINAFCVEHGRWTKRGAENAAAFDSSANQVSGKSLKIAVQQQANQGQVWRAVAANQAKLSHNAGASVADARSESSYELTLENKKVQQTTDAYVKDLAKIIDGQPDAIGYAMAVNGKVSSADVYASHALFVKLWPKLINSAAVEAFAELEKGKKYDAVKPEAIRATIEDADAAKAAPARDVTARVELVTRESKENIVFETRDRQAQPAAAAAAPGQKAEWLHRSYLTKDAAAPATPATEGLQTQIEINAPADVAQRANREEPRPQPAQQQQQGPREQRQSE